MSEAYAVKTYKNRDGDWKKVEAAILEIKKYADVMDGLIKDITVVEKKIQGLTFQAYRELPETDCLFLDCPISPTKQTYFLRAHLFREGFSVAKGVLQDTVSISDYSKALK